MDKSSETFTPTVRPFAIGEWRLYRDLRLQALLESPDAFGSTHAFEVQRSDTDWAERLALGVRSPRHLPLLAEVSGEPCGLAWVRIDEDDSSAAHLFQMWVAPTCRRQGAGRALLDAAVAWAQTEGVRILALDVTLGNGEAVRLYEGRGFVPVGSPKPLRSESHLQSQRMHLTLGSATGRRSA